VIAPTERPACVRGFLSPQECRDLIAEIDARPHAAPHVLGEKGEAGVDPDAWRSRAVELSRTSLEWIERRLWAVMPKLRERFDCEVAEVGEIGAFLYRKDDHFEPHEDTGKAGEVPDHVARRKISLVVALSDGAGAKPDFGGGELHIYPGFDPSSGDRRAQVARVRYRPGLLIAFPASTIHRVTPVTRGRRYSIVTWGLAPKT
jgi:predicted 2-oxoglutarate/Fe(II)-dependent dioxygenase YbiX